MGKMVFEDDDVVKSREHDGCEAFMIVPARDEVLAAGYLWALVPRDAPDRCHDAGEMDTWDCEVCPEAASGQASKMDMVKCLAFYADKDKWENGEVSKDGGRMARETLGVKP